MGQKTNSTAFRFGINKNEWKTKYFETNYEEFSLYTFQTIEIKKWIERFLNFRGLLFHNYKLYLTKNTIYIYISYLTTYKTFLFINKIKTNKKLQLLKKQNLKKKFSKKNRKYLKRLKIIKQLKKPLQNYKNSSKNYIKTQNFGEQFLENLSEFTKKKFNVILTFQNLNKGLSLNLNKIQTKVLKTKLIELRQYSRTPFFKETINIMLIVMTVKNSAKIFTRFIAIKLRSLKKHNFFFIFLKHTLITFIKTNFSKIQGIKIAIKGRFNGAPRARNRIILVGKVPIQTLNKKINYYQSVSYTPNGTFGVKVWICEI